MQRLLLLFIYFTLATPVFATETTQIFLAHAQRQDPTADTAAAVADEFRSQVKQMSGGRIKIEILADGLVGGNRDTAGLVDKGIIHSAMVSIGGVIPLYSPVAVIQQPFAFEKLETARKLLDGQFGQRLADDMAQRSKLYLFGFVDPTGFHILTNSKREVSQPEHLQGLRIRTVPGTKPVDALIRSLGAEPVKVSSREELSALSSGVIHGQMSSASQTLARGMDTAQRYATLTEHLYSPYVWIFNQKLLDALPPDDAELLRTAARSAIKKGHQLALSLQKSERGVLGLQKRLQVRRLSSPERDAFRMKMAPASETAIAEEIGQEGQSWLKEFKAALKANGR